MTQAYFAQFNISGSITPIDKGVLSTTDTQGLGLSHVGNSFP